MSPTTRRPAEPPAGDEPVPAEKSVPTEKPVLPEKPVLAEKPVPAEDSVLAEAKKTDATMWGIVGHMASALIVYGGLGYLLGRWTGHPILLLFGVLFGVVLSTWYTIHTVSKTSAVSNPDTLSRTAGGDRRK